MNTVSTDSASVSVIIPTLNRAAILERALVSIRRQSLSPGRYEIIVVDNGSVDDTAGTVARLNHDGGKPVRYVRETRRGLHNARHAGARAADGLILAFTDDDATFDPGWLQAYTDAFAAAPGMVAAGGPVRPVWEVSPPPWLLDFMAGAKTFGLLSLMEPYQNSSPGPQCVFFGVNMAIRRDTLFAVGGFNPEAFGDVWLGDGETGLNRKLWDQRLPVGYVAKALVYHHIPPQRMTVAYLRHRMANQGACNAYTAFHPGVQGSALLSHTAGVAVRNSISWLAALLLRGRTDPRSLRLQFHAAMTQSYVKYALRVLCDKSFRELVQKPAWLT